MATPRFEELKKKLIDGYPQDIEQIRDWEARFKQASLTNRLKKNPAFDMLIDKLDEQIKKHKDKLQE